MDIGQQNNAYEATRMGTRAVMPISALSEQSRRAWPPVMINSFVWRCPGSTPHVSKNTKIGDVIDYLAKSSNAAVAILNHGEFLGAAVDDDVMALIKRDGACALDYPISLTLQVNRPVVSITDSPYVVIEAMKVGSWDRACVSEKSRVVGIVKRRDLVRFLEI